MVLQKIAVCRVIWREMGLEQFSPDLYDLYSGYCFLPDYLSGVNISDNDL